MDVDYLPVGCFGKAPCDLEYLESNVATSSARKLKKWIREGFKAARQSENAEGRNDFREVGARCFLLNGSNGDEWIAGVVGPSTDQYPRENVLSVFAHVPRRAYRKAYAVLPLALAPVWHALEHARQQLLELATVDDFRDCLETTMVPAPVAPIQSTNEFQSRQREAVDRVFDRQDGACLDALERNLSAVVSRLRSRERASVAVEFPVSREVDEACFDASFWIHLVNRQFLWRKHSPSVFLDLEHGDRDRFAVLVYGEPEAAQYRPIMGPERRSEGLLRPSTDETVRPGGADASSASGISFKELLNRRFA